MGILDLIKKDIATFKEREPTDYRRAELVRLEAILNSGIIPTSYTSHVTNITYTASAEELNIVKPLATEVHYVFCKKFSRKRDALPTSEFSLYHSDDKPVTRFTIEHSSDHKYPDGGYARAVKKCYIPGEASPKYALKIFKANLFHSTNICELRTSMRNSFCNRILDRTGLSFRRAGKQYTLTDWLPGITLDAANVYDLAAIPIHKRISLALSLIRELAVLHKYGIVHKDIKPSNVMLNDNALHLFDFDGVSLENELFLSGPGVLYTDNFVDAQTNYMLKYNLGCAYKAFDVKNDIYALGLTLCFLFPDVITPNFAKRTVLVGDTPFQFEGTILKNGPLFMENKPLGELLLKLSSDNKMERPDSTVEVYKEFSTLQNKHYLTDMIDEVSPTPLDESPPLISGEEAFNQIESELVSFNTRVERFAAKPLVVEPPQPVVDHSYYLNYLTGVATSCAGLLVAAVSTISPNETGVLMGGTLMAACGLFSKSAPVKAKTDENVDSAERVKVSYS